MTQDDMITLIAQGTGCTRSTARATLTDLFSTIVGELAMGETPVRLPGVGTLMMRPTPAGQGRNPRTGEKIAIPAGHRVRFRPAKAMKDRLQAA